MQANPLHFSPRQNCSSTPKALMTVLGLIAGLSVFISLVFWVVGAPWILPFALLEFMVLVAAFVCHARAVAEFVEMSNPHH